ncbi:MAG: regulatory protein RecX [Acutalibacteraceae bacterium]|nr:regulatory protein RecX [Acutalibacteraceae bacterium]
MILTYKKGKGDKMHLLIDGEYFTTVDEMYFASLYLKDGQEIDEDTLRDIKNITDIRRAYNYAVSLLSGRDHSYSELMGKLKAKGFKDCAKEALLKLQAQGYIDDERFADMYVRELITLKKYGKKRIEQELYRKGVDRDIIKEVIENAEFPEDRLTDIIRKKYLRYLTDEKGMRKTVNALLRLGYSYSEIRDALAEINDLEVTDE